MTGVQTCALPIFAFPPWIAFIYRYRACPRTKGLFSLEHRSANQYHVNMHSTAITMSSRYREIVLKNFSGFFDAAQHYLPDPVCKGTYFWHAGRFHSYAHFQMRMPSKDKNLLSKPAFIHILIQPASS